MIKNERQYKITKSQIAKFETVLDDLVARSGANDRLRKLEKDALRSQLEELRGEVKHYEELRSSGPKPIHIESFGESDEIERDCESPRSEHRG